MTNFVCDSESNWNLKKNIEFVFFYKWRNELQISIDKNSFLADVILVLLSGTVWISN